MNFRIENVHHATGEKANTVLSFSRGAKNFADYLIERPFRYRRQHSAEPANDRRQYREA